MMHGRFAPPPITAHFTLHVTERVMKTEETVSSGGQCLRPHLIQSLPITWGLIPWLERIPGEGNGNPLQYSCVGNPEQRNQVGYGPWGHNELYMTE